MIQQVINNLKELLKWSDRLGSDEIMVINENINYLKEIQKRSITWSSHDFKRLAIQFKGDDWANYFDESLFNEAIEIMINKCDYNEGISWQTAKWYLYEYCSKPFPVENKI
jgi:hypothetical protein